MGTGSEILLVTIIIGVFFVPLFVRDYVIVQERCSSVDLFAEATVRAWMRILPSFVEHPKRFLALVFRSTVFSWFVLTECLVDMILSSN